MMEREHGWSMSMVVRGYIRARRKKLLELYARSRRPVLTEREQVEVCLFGGSGLRD